MRVPCPRTYVYVVTLGMGFNALLAVACTGQWDEGSLWLVACFRSSTAERLRTMFTFFLAVLGSTTGRRSMNSRPFGWQVATGCSARPSASLFRSAEWLWTMARRA
jgi:hypothetical protein